MCAVSGSFRAFAFAVRVPPVSFHDLDVVVHDNRARGEADVTCGEGRAGDLVQIGLSS